MTPLTLIHTAHPIRDRFAPASGLPSRSRLKTGPYRSCLTTGPCLLFGAGLRAGLGAGLGAGCANLERTPGPRTFLEPRT